MAKPRELNLSDWNAMVNAFHTESDRGAAVLAGGFVEHILGSYLRAMATVPSAADKLFSAIGPLASFSQRIVLAYSFGLISEEHYDDLNLIREIRNHFAHHPLDTTFATTDVGERTKKLSMFSMALQSDAKGEGEQNRTAYLFTCAMFAVYADKKILERKQASVGTRQD